MQWPQLDTNDKLEVIWVTLWLQRIPWDTTHLTIGTVYHPSDTNDKAMVTHLNQCMDQIFLYHPRSVVMLCSDFNHIKDSQLKRAHSFKQIAKAPTCGVVTLDMIYTDRQDYFGTPTIHPPVGLSDHNGSNGSTSPAQ